MARTPTVREMNIARTVIVRLRFAMEHYAALEEEDACEISTL
jgi:hypothetical protein